MNSNFMTKPRGYWSNRDNNDNSREREKESKREEGRERRENREKGKANMRKFLESFARARHCDPLLSHSWYQLADELRKQKVSFLSFSLLLSSFPSSPLLFVIMSCRNFAPWWQSMEVT